MFEDAVISDSVFGSGILTNYLIHRGHKRIAFVGSIHSTSSIMDRYIGYYRAITIMLKKLDDKSYTTGRVLITGSLIERDSVRVIEKADKQPAE